MQHAPPDSLPAPDADSAAHSERVAGHIRRAIDAAGGDISFAEFMHYALYAPGLGYYSAGSTKFGAAGDFVTAPEVSTVFGAVLARQCVPVLAELATPAILEFGAGSGKLAIDVLRSLADLDALPDGGYRILEVSAELRERQEERIRRQLPELADHVAWLDALPEPMAGIIIANEVLDALPVERFVRRRHGVRQVRVAAAGRGFVCVERPAPEVLATAVTGIEEALGARLADGYASDVCLAVPAWVRDVAAVVRQGAVFLFDYGVSRREYYAPHRSGGWLRCHFRHRVHDDPLVWPGIQDISSWVDFSVVAEAAVDAGLHVAGYTSQAQFLLAAGLGRHIAALADLPMAAQLKLSGEVKLLTLPGEMGENIKCMGLSRGLASQPAGFGLADRTLSL